MIEIQERNLQLDSERGGENARNAEKPEIMTGTLDVAYAHGNERPGPP